MDEYDMSDSVCALSCVCIIVCACIVRVRNRNEEAANCEYQGWWKILTISKYNNLLEMKCYSFLKVSSFLRNKFNLEILNLFNWFNSLNHFFILMFYGISCKINN